MDEKQWLTELKNAIKDPVQLLQTLELPVADFKQDLPARKLFPVFVTPSFVAKMEKGNPRDPLFLQAMCQQAEFQSMEGFSKDPLQEQHFAVPNILHKYHNRVLFMLKNSCAINCRYCFRRHFPYDENPSNQSTWQEAINYIATRPEIEEVIFSGGDPMMAKDQEWEIVLTKLAQIPHVQRIRIHSRLPVVIPSRITDRLCELLKNLPLQKVLVTHINHVKEIDVTFKQAMAKLQSAGVTLLNQSVLLKGVNDNAQTLKELSDALYSCNILPYYLHLLDKVEGASHYWIEDSQALAIYKKLQTLTSGFLVPKLAREIGGEPNKTLIS